MDVQPAWFFWIQVAYYVAGILTFVIAITGVIQLWMMKKVNSKNDVTQKKKEALSALEIFANEIIPKLNEYTEEISKLPKEDKIKFVKKRWNKKENINSDDIKKLYAAEYIMKSKISQIGSILNQLEHLCAYIEADILDEEILINPISHLLIEFVEENVASLQVHSELNNAPFDNLYKVYKRWKVRKEKDDLLKEKKIIDERLLNDK